MSSIDPSIHAAIDAEFAHAYAKHAGKTPRSWSVGDLASLAILAEEVGEVARELLDNPGETEHLADELIQVSTVAAAWAERLLVRGDR